jgi:hypothetical protein
MIIIASILGGAVLGVLRARKRGGVFADQMQYGAAHAIAFGLVGFLVTIIIERSVS